MTDGQGELGLVDKEHSLYGVTRMTDQALVDVQMSGPV